MSSQTREERIVLFREVTGLEDDGMVATCLARHNWDVQMAVQDFLSGASAVTSSPRVPAGRTQGTQPTPPVSGGARSARLSQRDSGAEGDDDEAAREDEALLGPGRQPPSPSRAPARAPTATAAATVFQLPIKALGVVFNIALFPLRMLTANREASPQDAVVQFIQSIEQDYGTRHPAFFRGSFAQAAQQAHREKKYLIVYIHSPLHEDTPAFCRRALTADTFVGFANDSALFWGGSVQQMDGYATSTLLEATRFPFLALIACHQARSLEVLSRIEGLLTVEEVLDRFTASMAQHQEVLEQQAETQRQREERSRLQEEQNREFQEALEADRRREAELEAERDRQAREEAEGEQRAEREAAHAKALKEEREAALRMKRARLPPEPAPPAPSMKLRLQFPQGAKADRRFSPSDTLQTVKDFIDVYVADNMTIELVNYSLSANFPRRTFDDMALTLQEAGLHSADTIYIQDLDS